MQVGSAPSLHVNAVQSMTEPSMAAELIDFRQLCQRTRGTHLNLFCYMRSRSSTSFLFGRRPSFVYCITAICLSDQ